MRTNCRKLTPFGRRLLVDRVLTEGWPVGYRSDWGFLLGVASWGGKGAFEGGEQCDDVGGF